MDRCIDDQISIGHSSEMDSCILNKRFQLGHFFSEMDSEQCYAMRCQEFQLGHFFSEMDSDNVTQLLDTEFQLGHFFSEMDRHSFWRMGHFRNG